MSIEKYKLFLDLKNIMFFVVLGGGNWSESSFATLLSNILLSSDLNFQNYNTHVVY